MTAQQSTSCVAITRLLRLLFVLFTGTLSYLPNRQGIAWFCREVWPKLPWNEMVNLVSAAHVDPLFPNEAIDAAKAEFIP